ncbi:hypothetical protein L8C07_25915 [Paenibacillus sp. CMAA1739]|nr:hypothetical protein [Paenibacillus sp. CMAA1739]MEC4569386.1 hypothetical protein [Paenibacillus sp. CMAA1739]
MTGFREDEEVTSQDLLYGTILTSGGETGNSLDVHVAGNVEDFVLMMNDKTAELVLNGTHFTSPESLHDDNQYKTASHPNQAQIGDTLKLYESLSQLK